MVQGFGYRLVGFLGFTGIILLMEEILHRFNWPSKVETPHPLFYIDC